MSNQVVGSVYQQIIEKVVATSMNDFEEYGVDQSTLDEMKQGWQDKLSSLFIAQFPWDPQPEPPRQPPTVPSNVKTENDLPPLSAQPEHLNFPNVAIKSESRYEPPASSYPPAPQMNGGNRTHEPAYAGYDQQSAMAPQRAQALVAQRMQQNGGMMHQQHGGSQMPMHSQQQQQQQQSRVMPQPQRSQQMPPQRQPQPNHMYTSQTDGAGDAAEDWHVLMAARATQDDDGPDGRIAADQFMRARVDALAAQQDNGLMVPLDQVPKGKKRKASTRVRQAKAAKPSAESGPARFDGDDEEENDEDAINSDLDDPEDDLDGADDSENENVDYMLCTYDKVQRVKNKWKCTLKDGILTTNKKEYLFHKANGEFEW